MWPPLPGVSAPGVEGTLLQRASGVEAHKPCEIGMLPLDSSVCIFPAVIQGCNLTEIETRNWSNGIIPTVARDDGRGHVDGKRDRR